MGLLLAEQLLMNHHYDAPHAIEHAREEYKGNWPCSIPYPSLKELWEARSRK